MELLVRHLLEQVVSQRWLVVETVNFIPDHLIVLVVFSQLDLKQPFNLLVELDQLSHLVLGDLWDLVVEFSVVLSLELLGHFDLHFSLELGLDGVLRVLVQGNQLLDNLDVLLLLDSILSSKLLNLLL